MLCVGEITTSIWNHYITDDVMWNSSVLWYMGNGDVMSGLISTLPELRKAHICEGGATEYQLSLLCDLESSKQTYDVMVRCGWYVWIFENYGLLSRISDVAFFSMHIRPIPHSPPLLSPSPYTYTQSTSLSLICPPPPSDLASPLSLPPPLHTSTSISSSSSSSPPLNC